MTAVTPGTPTNLVTQDELTDAVEAERYRISGAPKQILDGETYIVPERRQVLYLDDIVIEDGGTLTVEGELKQVRQDFVESDDLTTALAGKLDTTDAAVTNAREWTAETVSQAEAEAGTATTRRAWTAERVRQAAVAANTLAQFFRPFISVQPSNPGYTIGSPVTFSVTASSASGTGLTNTFQWQVSEDGGANWSNVGTDSASYTTPNITAWSEGFQWRCIVTNQIGPTTSNAVTLRTYLFDSFATGIATAYSLRRLRNAYAGSQIRVRRSSDNAQQDFTEGGIRSGALASWVGAGDGFVTTWYDQVGTNHATQTNAALQPRIVVSGALVVNDKSLPGVRFVDGNLSGIEQSLSMLPWHTVSDGFVALLSVYQMNNSGFFASVLGSNPTSRGLISLHNSASRAVRTAAIRTGGLAAANGAVLATSRSYVRLDTANRTNLRTWLNKTATATVDTADRNENFSPITNYVIGNDNSVSPTQDIVISEMLFFNASYADRQTLMDRISDDYTVTL